MSTRRKLWITLGSALLVAVTAAIARGAAANARWSAAERATLASLSLASLPPLEPDPSNRVADDSAAAALGRQLFFDQRLSADGRVSCATCHLPDREFQDGAPLATGVGMTTRRTMPIAGTAYSPWLFWDGRADSQWAQALGPLESAVEHGGDRTQYAHIVAAHYRAPYERVFGALPGLAGLPERAGPVADSARRVAWERIPAVQREDISRVYANIGKAIAAFERRVEHVPTRFDRYVAVELANGRHTPESALTKDEEAGLRLFIGKANCLTCHNGPRFTDDHFHNTGVAVSTQVPVPDSGRATGVHGALTGEFNCLSKYSDARREQCAELEFAVTSGEELLRAYKTPSLRGVAQRAPYMHAGQLATLRDVMAHYNTAPAAPAGHSELRRLRLDDRELAQIEAFLRTLSAPPRVR
jgi:cytochrome c peroxidase